MNDTYQCIQLDDNFYDLDWKINDAGHYQKLAGSPKQSGECIP